jgi:hypothetical protein
VTRLATSLRLMSSRQRDRETERQRDGETERRRDLLSGLSVQYPDLRKAPPIRSVSSALVRPLGFDAPQLLENG